MSGYTNIKSFNINIKFLLFIKFFQSEKYIKFYLISIEYSYPIIRYLFLKACNLFNLFNLNFCLYVKFMGNIFKFYRQKLTVDNNYTLLYMKFFYQKC